MKQRLAVVFALLGLLALAQTGGVTVSGTSTGTGQNITGSITLPFAPSAIAFSCSSPAIAKGQTVSCTATLDAPVPAGMTATITLTTSPATGFTVATGTPTIAAGASSATFAITRQ